MMRPCLERGCTALTTRTRCIYHTRSHDRTRRPSATQRYGAGFAERHRSAVEAEPWCHNPTCPHPDAGTDANPLTADHSHPASRGGQAGPLVPLCKRCNSAKGNRTG